MMILKEITKYLIDYDFTLSKQFADGRINASINEDEIINIIKQKFEIEVPRARNWFDFSIEHKWIFYPVNIKVTDTTHADNLNCKIWIYYALTWKMPDFPNETSRKNYFEKLRKNIKENNKDYYFLIINKKNLKDIFFMTLKTLENIQPNWNNLPFQCKWDINRKQVKRTFEESKYFILNTFGKSIKLRAEIYFIFKKLFNEFL